MKEVLVVCLLFVGCTTGYSVINLDNETNETVTEETITYITNETEDEEVVEVVEKPLSEEDRRLVARSFGLFNYSVLTSDTCEYHQLAISDTLQEEEENVAKKSDILDDERKDAKKALQAYHAAQGADNQKLVRETFDDLDQEDEEEREAEDDLEDEEELLKKYEIIFKEIERLCHYLEAKQN